MKSLRTRLSLTFGAGALGLIINLFPIYVFTGAHFYFGGALDVFAGIVLGPQYGLLAAAIAYLPLAREWDQVPANLFFVVEAGIIAWAVRRHKVQPVLADFVFRS